MIDWTPYLKSISDSEKYAQWETFYTLTDVEGKTRPSKTAPLLRDLWVQTIEKERENPQERAERPEKPERFTVLDGLRKYATNHVLLKGRPGSGKSTALARLLLEESVGAQSLHPNQQNQAKIIQIPILIELRLYETSILDLILQFLKRHKLIIDSNTLESWLLENQNFSPLLLFDGINELPSDTARQNLKNFRQQYAEIPMIFTTRDLGSDDLNIEKKLEMLPLTEPQMRDFVKVYLPEKGEEMLKQLGNRLKEFGQTPLLLWMLCSVFDNNQNKIPANLGLVFQIFTGIYDKKLKADVPTYKESRDWWRELLQVLAWKMTQGESKTEIQVAISRTEAEEELSKFIKNKGFPEYYSKQWLKDLLKYHLIHLEGNDKIAFRHQLIQEYYTAEELKKKLPHLRDEQLKWDYLNYLKWTEPMALLLGLLDNETQAKRVVKLGLEIDLKLGARLAGEVNFKFQKQTVGLVLGLDVPKRFKVELLGLTKSNQVVNELSQALKDSDWGVRWNAAEALGNIGSEAAIPGLLKALEHSDDDVRMRAALALSKIGSETAIAELLKALEHSDDDVRMRAALALSNIGSEAAIPGLLKALEHSDDDVRMRAALALSKIGSETAIAELLKALKDSDWYVRSHAALALGKIGSETAITWLLKALKDSNSIVRMYAAKALGKIGTETAIQELLKALEDSDDWSVRRNAAFALAEIGTETAIPELLKALEDSNKYVRIKAAEALGKIGSETAIAGLLKALEHSDDDDRWKAAEALGKIGSETAIAELLKALEHSDEDVRGNAALALGNIGSETAITGLLKALEESNKDVRWKAAFALGKIGSETAIAGLLKALKDSDSLVRMYAAEALGKIGSETAIPGLLKALEYSNKDVRRKAAEALGKIGSEAAMTELIKCLKNPDFVTLNNGDTLSPVREALDTIQNKLKYYHPISQPMNQQVYISYNWQEDSNEMANQLVQAFDAKGIEIIRDKTHTSYKDSIKNFMRQIGRGKCVVAVISDRYLKSENCMFELVEIARNGDFYQRIFPIILPDARIYKDFERIDYLKYWEDEKAKLQAKYKQLDLVNTNSIMATLNLYDEIRDNIDNLTNILKDMNNLNIDLHSQSEFAAMIKAVETKLAEDSQNI
ncbi:MAG: HEAT repeat domain-containing protein [Microcystis sp. M54BS1]|uniref:HEAT repeat domain-containing protein n=5 Tax=Microcystis TaxID=1125 RepID=UPI00257C0C2C|nr:MULTISPECIES: HEAT repeat domain-containing protein [unclassified Microcystis]MCA2542121.1 HEAT repeat domain-containing protein [Microcystis sp. M54BS1]MCA2612333.1 HEAT repeat domain-containing protein [Microcystis sp. M27BS1]MCA2507010.1 HEAT repeat domain-containing protein [Microcystis sp. M62BS1]MCA2509568.1 HEAT repeat domain-containing protein [Microcystis sp. M60BS1]MCA2514292.1 HEAT repeat domain-containing protein [Microcystis sp. M59BS1]